MCSPGGLTGDRAIWQGWGLVPSPLDLKRFFCFFVFLFLFLFLFSFFLLICFLSLFFSWDACVSNLRGTSLDTHRRAELCAAHSTL
ncbi:unnamed protein product [Discosporangium mesarthrocarpum]